MTTTNNEIDCIVAEVTTILRNRLNTLVNNVKNDETNEAVLNLPIVKKVLDSVKGQTIINTTSNNNDDEIRQLQKDSQSCKEDIKTLTNMCLQISKAISDLQSSIGNLSDKQNNLTKYIEQTKEAENIQIKIVEKEKPKPNIIFIEEDDEEEDNNNNTFEIKEEVVSEEDSASLEEEEQEEDSASLEEEEQVASEAEEEEVKEVEQSSEVEEEEAEVSKEEEQVASEAEEEEEASEADVASESEVEEQEEVASEAEKEVEQEEVEQEEEGGLEVFEIEIDDVTYFATDEENGDLYEVDKDGDIGKKVGFIKDGEVEFI
jgi:hypothetical protein